jgi:putative peptide zinc metalloprotease protein
VTFVETRISLWEALAGRAPGQPLGPADPGLWRAVAERVNPAKARPVLRAGIEEAALTSVRGVAYTMLRSPDGRNACYLRLAPEEVELAHLMDGSRTLARLVADFARISGRLAPDQVRRVVADLAGNRMLEELPVDAFSPLQRLRRRPWPVRLGRGLLAFVQGRRVVLANVDPLVTFLYQAGGRLFFTRAVAALMFAVAAVGLVAFGWQWWTGEQSVFLTNNSYFAGAAVLLGLNMLALASHELGHALAAKHSGRRVPAAGFLVYFGIPSVFVDTTDVWMAGRRARLRTTFAGPSTGLVLAGASALVGFLVPSLAPWCFKLSFAWYINALFNLNPFLALDGYYLVMDWLEVPNLRARGLAWVAARIRRRPPRWGALDREGRLVALYGLLAVGWLVIALNIAYRVYADRVWGLSLGLWRSGWAARALLVVLVAALAAPIVYVLCGWFSRRWRRLRERLQERRRDRDAPRRLDALRASSLRDLPAVALAQLAAQARWVRPRTGEQLVFAGGAQPHMFTVVEGALEARAPGDPGGTVRERVGVGGVVGLGPALTGTPSPLAWYAAGTKLLAIPSPAVASAVGPTAAAMGAGGATGAEAEALFSEAPALSALSYSDRLGLASAAVAVNLPPGVPVSLDGPDDAIVVASGIIATPNGYQLGRGTLIGPAGTDSPGAVAETRSPVRLFALPAVSGSALLLGATASTLAAQSTGGPNGGPPVFGVHPPHAYPPLAGPPTPPPPGSGDDGDRTDRRFEKRLRWLLLLVLLLAFGMTTANVFIAPLAWGEMPSDRALLQALRGKVHAIVDGDPVVLDVGDAVYVRQGDTITVDPRSRGQLTYRGGGASILCAQSETAVGALESTGHPVQPTAALTVRNGIVLTDAFTKAPAAFAPLAATQDSARGETVNEGTAWFAVAPWGTLVSVGTVRLDGALLPPTEEPLGCGDGEGYVLRPSGIATPEPIPTDTPTPPTTPGPTDSSTPTVTESPTAAPTTPPTTTATTTGPPPTTPHTTTAPPTTPVNNPPRIVWIDNPGGQLDRMLPTGKVCNPRLLLPLVAAFLVRVTDENPPTSLHVKLSWTGTYNGSVDMLLRDSNAGTFYGQTPVFQVGPNGAPAGSIKIHVTATDKAGLSTTVEGKPIDFPPCPLG